MTFCYRFEDQKAWVLTYDILFFFFLTFYSRDYINSKKQLVLN